MTGRALPFVPVTPDVLFGIECLAVDGQTVYTTMPAGPWLTGVDGRVRGGALGVLVDDVLGYAILAAGAADRWSVTTVMTLDVFSGLQASTGSFRAEARVEDISPSGGFAVGRVYSGGGDLVATCSQRGHFVDRPRRGLSSPAGGPGPDHDAPGVAELLGIGPGGGGSLRVVSSSHRQNPMGNLHGGVILCGADLLAGAALEDPTLPPLATTSVSVTFLRPVPDGATLEMSTVVVHRGRSLGVVDILGRVDDRTTIAARVTANGDR